jgi:hypothetical protein
MSFSFAGRGVPMTVRVGRSLLWTQAAFITLAGLFVVLVSTLFGNSNSIPFGSNTLSGGGAAMLGVVYIVAGLVVGYLGIEFGRLTPWSRTAIASVQAFLAVLLLFRSFDLSLSLVINVVLFVAILALVFAPDTRRAFASGVPRRI